MIDYATMERDDVVNAIEKLRSAEVPQLWLAKRRAGGDCRRLGVMSASFNPLTSGHVRMIELAHQRFAFDEKLLVLALANVDKGASGFSIVDRIALMEAWGGERPDVLIAMCSHGRFVEKIRAIRDAYGSATIVMFLVGYDTLVRLFDPKYYRNMMEELDHLFSQCEFVAFNRGGVGVDSVRSFMQRPVVAHFAEKIHLMELDPFYASLSATQVRSMLERGASVRGLVPDEVADALMRR